jgi:hypothetical protein
MVFCDEPYYNEPGREAALNAAASDAENRALQGHTVEHAMLFWLNKLPLSTGKAAVMASTELDMQIWGDVVWKHFETHGKQMLETVKGWKGKRMVSELTTGLKSRGFLD